MRTTSTIRRAVVTTALAAAVAGSTATAASAVTVNQEKLVIAAQLDQYRPSAGTTPGADDDVKALQRALRGKGYAVTVDGNYGAETTSAYTRWQRRLGFSGLDANGLPGRTSLERLGFTIAQPVQSPGARQAYSGVTLNARTIAMLRAAGSNLGAGCVLDPSKGSYTGPDGDSAGTHAGGGAVDLSVRTLCGHTTGEVVRALRTVGFAAWYRNWTGNLHIHAVAISDLDMATESVFPGVFDTREQVVGYAQGKDGLNGATVGPMTIDVLNTWERYKRTH